MYDLIILSIIIVYLIFVLLRLLNIEPDWIKNMKDDIDSVMSKIYNFIISFLTGKYFDPIIILIFKLIFSLLISVFYICCLYFYRNNTQMLTILISGLVLIYIIFNLYKSNKLSEITGYLI